METSVVKRAFSASMDVLRHARYYKDLCEVITRYGNETLKRRV